MLQGAADAGSYLPFLEDSAGTSSLGDRVSIDIGIQLRDQYSPDELTTAIVHQAIIDALPRWNELERGSEQVYPIGVG